MYVFGYCTECRKYRSVRATGHALVMAQATRGAVEGTCHECDDKEDSKRKLAAQNRGRA
jgi:hypothetical protein